MIFSRKSIIKKINYQLNGNFFSLEEFKTLPDRKAFKVIKTIAAIEDIKLSRSEIKSIVSEIKSIESKKAKTEDIAKLFNVTIEKRELTNNENEYSENETSFNFIYRLNREKVLRI